MNATHTAPTIQTRSSVAPPVTARRYNERTTGTGYGRSSGYAASRRYTSDWGQVRFRCG
ncbi:MAG TPA: hypothetical protein VGE64_05550 [Xanthomonadaceae bacterium]